MGYIFSHFKIKKKDDNNFLIMDNCTKKMILKNFGKKNVTLKIKNQTQEKGIYLAKYDEQKIIIKIKKTESLGLFEMKIYDILKVNHHKNICKLVNIFSDEYTYTYTIWKFYDGMDLYKYLFKKNGYIEYEIFKNILYQTMLGIEFIHSKNIVHCDLKLENIIIVDKKIKIIDFDLSIVEENDFVAESVFGTTGYIAPESYDLCIYSKKSDIWSLGVVFYLLITNIFPEGCCMNKMLVTTNSYSNLERMNSFKHLSFNLLENCAIKKNYDIKILEIIKSMLSFKDKNRSTAIELVELVELVEKIKCID